MPCYYPQEAWYSKEVNRSGKRSLVFKECQGLGSRPLRIACGQCIGCKLERSRRWAVRCVHEASLYEYNCFLTLTLSDEFNDGSLHKRFFQLFMKRFRKKFGEGIRYFHCGEYGEKFGRPHYHACIFNFAFTDLYEPRRSKSGSVFYRSHALEELWPFGHSSVGALTFESAAYVARYVTKKITGDKALEHYTVFDRETGEVLRERLPEYTTMSRRPGIGRGWYETYKSDVYPGDFVLLDRKGSRVKMSPPKYYDNLFELEYPSDFKKIKVARKIRALHNKDNNSRDRLYVREKIQLIKFKQLIRGFEDDL